MNYINYGILIPVYRHGKSCYEEVSILLKYGIPIIIVDDGNDDETKEWLKKAVLLDKLVNIVELHKNLGLRNQWMIPLLFHCFPNQIQMALMTRHR